MEETMAVLQLDATEPYTSRNTQDDGSALFPSTPIYARPAKRYTASKLALMVGAPVVAILVGVAAWGLMSQPAQTPTIDQAPPAKIAEATPSALPETALPAPMPQPAPAATPAPTQVARAETAPRAAPVRRAAPARRAAPQSAPDAGSASSNASATVPAPVAAPPAPPVVIAAPVAAAPTPPPTPAPAPTATPTTPTPNTPM
jgi:Meckel syndrome type 1 protein